MTDNPDRRCVAEAWDALARSWADLQGETGDGNQTWIINPALFRLAGELQGVRVLDAACGGGHLSRELARRGAVVTGVDISPAMVEIARAHQDAGMPDIRYLVGDLSSMPEIPDASFDLVVSSMALMNVENVAGAFAEFARVLCRGGHLIFSIPHPCYPRIKGGRGVFKEGTDGEEWLEDYRVADYQAEGRYDVSFPTSEGNSQEVAIATFHRTLGTYVSLLSGAGFVVDALVEPKPPDTAEAKSELGPGWWDATNRIPYYLVLGARRSSQILG